MLKKWLALFLSVSMVCLMGACSSDSKETQNTGQETSSQTSETADTAKAPQTAEKVTGSVEGGKQYQAVIDVEGYGPITLTLDEGIAPQTVQNFVKLAQSGFYDGLTFHRIMDGFMIQGGDPNGNGTGGSSKNVVGEFASNGFDNTLSHKKGVISMARSQLPNSGSSQFFICEEDSPSLDGNYAAFGWVTDGMDIVESIAQDAQPTDNNGTIPKDQQPVIHSITITELN